MENHFLTDLQITNFVRDEISADYFHPEEGASEFLLFQKILFFFQNQKFFLTGNIVGLNKFINFGAAIRERSPWHS
jgi:hypothetical protein